jgi:hypothetical protein
MMEEMIGKRATADNLWIWSINVDRAKPGQIAQRLHEKDKQGGRIGAEWS